VTLGLSASERQGGPKRSVRNLGYHVYVMHPKIPEDQSSPLDGIFEDPPPSDEEMPELDKAADARNRKLTGMKPESEEHESSSNR
jgi:hypothetical protein